MVKSVELAAVHPVRPETLFYLDPPYHGSEGDYGKGLFGRDQFAALAERLRRLRGRFILSINDVPEIREAFAGFELTAVDVPYQVSGGRGSMGKELIILLQNPASKIAKPGVRLHTRSRKQAAERRIGGAGRGVDEIGRRRRPGFSQTTEFAGE